MRAAALVLACLARNGHGRRVQSSVRELEGNPSSAGREEPLNEFRSVPRSHSLAEVNSSFVPSAPQARFVQRPRSAVSHVPLTSQGSVVGDGPRSAASHVPLTSQGSIVGEGAQALPPSNSSLSAVSAPKVHRIRPVSMSATIDTGLDTGHEHGDMGSTSAEEKEPWYTNLGLNALVLVIAKVFTRVSVFYRNRVGSRVDIPLILGIALWYLGNYQCNVTTKVALKAAGGSAGFPLTIATLQLAVGALYAVFLWLAPDARPLPKITFKDYLKTLPVGLTAGYAHASTHFALSAGSVSFSQIIKTAEPVFVALLGTAVYGASVSPAKWLCLIPVIGGVSLAIVGELQFSWAALVTAANLFAAVKGNENKKLMTTAGIKDRLGSVGNQFAITMINSTLFCIPLMLIREGHKLGDFVQLCQTNPVVPSNVLFSGLWFYLYSELATRTIKKTGAVTQSVLNTAKRVIVIVVVALVMGESLGPLKLIGCLIGIGGVFLYSIIDRLIAKKEKGQGH